MSNKVVLALACAAFVGASLVGVGASAAVTHLKQSNFDETVSDGKVHFIKFYAPWCGHCKRLAPAWEDLYKGYKGSDRISIESVDCTQEKAVCEKAGIRGYPTLKIFQGGEDREQYKGARELADLKKFADSQGQKFLDLTTE